MTLFFFGDERDCNRRLPLNLPFYFVIPSLVVVAALRRESYSVWRRVPLVLRILKNVGLISGRDYGYLMERFASISIYRLIQH
jgi:hypothetical protein